MNSTQLFSNGARLVRRHMRLLVWIFVVNILLAWWSSGPAKTSFSRLMNHSMAGSKLVDRFDIGTLVEVIREPEVPLRSFTTASLHFSLVFLLYMIFINGGVLTVYREDRRLTRAEFFEMSGGYFWRMVRLVLVSLIPFAILGWIYQMMSDWSDDLSRDAAGDRTGFWVLMGACLVLWIATLFVRAWFDLAQSITVAENLRGMLRASWRSLVLSLRNGSLLISYLLIHAVGIVAMVALLYVFLNVPPARFRLSFVVLELVVLVDIAVRLWQKAACMTWFETQPKIAVPAFTPAPSSVVSEPTPLPPPPEDLQRLT